MNRTVSFSYSGKSTPDAYMHFFDRLMSRHQFSKVEDEELAEQVCSNQDIETAVGVLQKTLSSNDRVTFDSLGNDLVEVLTRVVSYRRLTFQHLSLPAQVTIKMSLENDFPVMGIELWQRGVAALPAGMFTVVAEDGDFAKQLADDLLSFKQQCE